MLPEIVSALHGCLVPSCPGGNDNVLYEKDFAEYRANIDQKLSELQTHVSSWVRSDLSSTDIIEILSLATLLRGEHSKKALWTTESSPRLSQDIFQSLTSAYESSHSINIFNDSKIVKAVLSLLRPHLMHDTFRCNPAASACYGWFLTQIQYSIMGNFLQEFFPTALILADDYEPANIQLGLESLSYMIENIAVEKLKWYGHDEVILDVLNKCLYLREAPIVSAHLKCFTSLMSKDLKHNKSLKRFSYDEIVKKILVNMYMEQKLDLRRVYSSQLTEMVEARGLGVVRHLTIIMKILSEYTLESSTTADALRAMTKVVQVCWCRGDSVGQEVLVIFMKVLILSSQKPPQIQFTLISSEVHQLAVVLQEAFPTVVEQYLHKMNENRSLFDPNLLTLVSDVFSYQPSP